MYTVYVYVYDMYTVYVYSIIIRYNPHGIPKGSFIYNEKKMPFFAVVFPGIRTEYAVLSLYAKNAKLRMFTCSTQC